MIKVVITIIVSLSMIVMTACGNNANNNINTETTTVETTEEQTETTEEQTETTEEQTETTKEQTEKIIKDIKYFNNIKDSITAKTDHVQYSTYHDDLVLNYYLIDENNLYFDMDVCKGYSIEILVTEDSNESYIVLNSPNTAETLKVTKVNDENKVVEQMIPVIELFKINEIKDVSMQDDAYVIECTLTISDTEFEGYVYCQQDTDEVLAFSYIDNDNYINTAIYECINLPRNAEDYSEAKEINASEVASIVNKFMMEALNSVDDTLDSDIKTE